MRKLLIALGVLVVLLIAIDRIGVVVAENQISDRIATVYGLSEKPGVSITGFPFLTQVISGNYQQVDVTANQIQADGATLHDLNVHLTGVHATISQLLGSGASTVTADRAAGSALVDFATVNQRLPHGFRVTSGGQNLTVSGTVNLSVSADGITVTPQNVTIPGGISLPVADLSQLRFVVPLSNLPLHLHLTSVRVTPGGLRISAAARNVQFARA